MIAQQTGGIKDETWYNADNHEDVISSGLRALQTEDSGSTEPKSDYILTQAFEMRLRLRQFGNVM
jgi:hypothetical protein